MSRPALKPKPNLIIQKNATPFKTTSASVLNSFFNHYQPSLATDPEQMPAYTPEMEPTRATNHAKPAMPKMQPTTPRQRENFFNIHHVGKGSEDFGDLLTGLASGDFPDAEFSGSSGVENPSKKLALNPAAMFSRHSQLTLARNQQQQLLRQREEAAMKKRLEEEELKRRRKMGR